VFVGADDEARIESVQSLRDLVRQAREQLPGVAAQASWEETASSMAALLGGLSELPELERLALYGTLRQSYVRHGKTPPAYGRGRTIADIEFQHDERTLFADRALQQEFTRIAELAQLVDEHQELSSEARAAAEAQISAVQQLLERKPQKTEAELIADIQASLRETTQTLTAKEHTS
jgi:hypothetical protein